jgi:hypothetical protein
MMPSKLPAPLSTLQAATATVEKEMMLIFPVLAKAVGCDDPKADFSDFIRVVKDYEETTKQAKKLEAAKPNSITDGLAEFEITLLKAITEKLSDPDGTTGVYSLKETLLNDRILNGLEIQLGLKMLFRRGLIDIVMKSDTNTYSYSTVGITEEGWTWIIANKSTLLVPF